MQRSNNSARGNNSWGKFVISLSTVLCCSKNVWGNRSIYFRVVVISIKSQLRRPALVDG